MTINREQLKDLIISKFGSLRRFCDLTEPSYNYNMLRQILTKNNESVAWKLRARKETYNIARRTSDRVLKDEISRKDREWLKQAIKHLYGSVNGFNREYPQMPVTTVRDIIDGRTKKTSQDYMVLVETVSEDLDKQKSK